MRVIVEEKLDGVSVCLTYQGGKLESMVTRGDGEVGDDIISHAVHIRGIPLHINEDDRLQIRGEIVLPLADYRSYWVPKKAKNPRNQVSGLCKGRSSPADLKTLQFVAYDYYGFRRGFEITSEEEVLKALEEFGFQTPQLVKVLSDVNEATQFYEEYDKGGRDKLPYLTDGLVYKIDSLSLQAKFSTQSNRPGWAVAVKPSPKAVVTKVKSVTWEMGLSGRFSPVAQVEPKDLDGTTLRNVNLFNLDQLKRWYEKGFGIGAEILVIRTGDILPHLKEVVVPAPNHPILSESSP